MCLKTTQLVANSVDPDQMLHFVAFDLGPQCLLRPVCPSTYTKHGKMFCYILAAGTENTVFQELVA